MMKRQSISLVLSILSVLLICSCRGNLTVKWWTSTPSKQWEEQRNVLLEPADSFKNIDAEIFTDSIQQKIEGFGGCFNEMGWSVLSKLDKASREKVIKMLFCAETGLRFEICRIPVGANDFSNGYYSLDDSLNDYSLEYFTIDRDKDFLIPYIKSALNYNEHLKIWSSPWTPPAWMKINKNYACSKSKKNIFQSGPEGREGMDLIRNNDTIFKTYAKYLSRYIKAYKDEGINIDALHVQNEFNSCQIFPSCTWKASTLASFIGNYLGPQFNKDHIKTDIWLGTIERSDIRIIDTIMNSEKCRNFIKGFGFQWGGKELVKTAHMIYPSLELMQTESECGNGSNDWKAAEYTFSLMKSYFNSGVGSYMYWNMVLDETGKSFWGWKQNSLISINIKKNKIIYNPEYFLFKHFSYFVEPGSIKVQTKGKYEDILAFITPGNALVIVLANNSSVPKIIRLKIAKKIIEVAVPKSSFSTFVYYNAI
jgi:glucosylceramidase